MADIVFHKDSKIFHLYNQSISYMIRVMENGQLGQLYYGKRIHDREDYGYLEEMSEYPMASCVFERDRNFSLEHLKQEFPVYGSSDYRCPAVEILQENGSRISDFQYQSYEVLTGKPSLPGLPATYTESPEEALTLKIVLKDPVTGVAAELLYTIFSEDGILARSVRLENQGNRPVHLLTAMSASLDLPDSEYQWLQLSGAWARERHVVTRPLAPGITAIDSMRGHSSHEQNPFAALLRPHTTEEQGEVIGISLVYSGNFRIQAEVDNFQVTRLTAGINPRDFDWKLEPGESFQTPEAVLVYTDQGLNAMSQIFHRLYQKRLARGYWRDRERPILLNNWEATYFNFTEERLLEIASKAKECGVELFVLDDGWFGERSSDRAGLGDWRANKQRLPQGIGGFAGKIQDMGMMFGLWIEPEMVNKDSNLYRSHPDWILQVPGRNHTHGRFQYVLDFSRKEVVDGIAQMLDEILCCGKVSYIKWDMNRSITECWSEAYPADRQGEIFHRYILGVYDLYERLTSRYPKILFESCASGGARFDPGMLYYAPQVWTSDDSDAVERLKIQYGTSLCYPVSSMGSHVSAVPNHQVNRMTPLHTRANVAYFGTFGYELDLGKLTEAEIQEVKEQVKFMKKYRKLLQFGSFYRLKSPFEGNVAAWSAVSQDGREAIVGWYQILNVPNPPYTRLKLQGLDADCLYEIVGTGETHYGDELMNLGLITSQRPGEPRRDFDSKIFVLKAKF